MKGGGYDSHGNVATSHAIRAINFTKGATAAVPLTRTSGLYMRRLHVSSRSRDLTSWESRVEDIGRTSQSVRFYHARRLSRPHLNIYDDVLRRFLVF